MKKYIVFSLVSAFIFGLFITNVNQALAITSSTETSYVSGCKTGDKFSRTTGERCSDVGPIKECALGDKFSSITGMPCTTVEPASSSVKFSYMKLAGTENKYQFSLSSNKLFDKVVVTPQCTDNKIEITSIYGKDKCRSFKASLRPTYGIEHKITLVSKDSYTHYANVKADIYYKGVWKGSKTISVTVDPEDNNSGDDPVISGIKGPQYLKVGQKGTWKVSAYDMSGEDLSYSVNWGDQSHYVVNSSGTSEWVSQQSATFTHKYSQAGTYTPTFTVTNAIGQTAQTSLSVKVGNVATAKGTLYIEPSDISLNIGGTKEVVAYYQPPMPTCSAYLACAQVMPSRVKVDPDWSIAWANDNSIIADFDYNARVTTVKGVSAGNTELTARYTPPGGTVLVAKAKVVVGSSKSYITVLSPNGGETWGKGTTQYIKWYYDGPVPSCMPDLPCIYPFKYDIYLLNETSDGDHGQALMAENVSGSSYRWVVSHLVGNSANTGRMKIKVCLAGSETNCDLSDRYFKITSGTTDPSIEVLSPNGGETWSVGTKQQIQWKGVNIPTNGAVGIALEDSLKVNTYLFTDIANTGSINWTIPSTIKPGKYKMRIWCGIKNSESYCGPGSFTTTSSQDYSNNYFTIVSATIPSPAVDISADQTNIASGQSTVIRWTSANATSCSGSGSGDEDAVFNWQHRSSNSLEGVFLTGGLTKTTTFAIACSNGAGGIATDSVVVNVSAVSTQPLTINASRHSSSPYGNLGTGENRELFRVDIKASGKGAMVKKLNLGLVGPAISNSYVTNIKAYVDGNYVGKSSDRVNTSSWYYTGVVDTGASGLTIEEGDTVTVSFKGDVSSSSVALNSWMWLTLDGIVTDPTPSSVSGLQVHGHQLNISSSSSSGIGGSNTTF